MAGDTALAPTPTNVKNLRRGFRDLKQFTAEQALERRLVKIALSGNWEATDEVSRIRTARDHPPR